MTKSALLALTLCGFPLMVRAQPQPVFQIFNSGITKSSGPYGMTAGPDGALWFTELAQSRIGRISPDGSIQEMAIPSAGAAPVGITTGPDGALWFAEGGAHQIGRITIAGAISEYPVSGTPNHITVGPDGALWFSELTDGIGRITTAGVFTQYPVPKGVSPEGITAGPDGALWFADIGGDRIGRITTAGVVTTFSFPAGGPRDPAGIVTGPDGALWFTEFAAHSIGRMTTAGEFKEFPLTSSLSPYHITNGPDGALWFTEQTLGPDGIGRISTSGAITEYTVPGAKSPSSLAVGLDGALWITDYDGDTTYRALLQPVISESTLSNDEPLGIAPGPDGAMWFTEYLSNRIGRITPAGAINEYTIPTGNTQPYFITAGPDGAMWFTEFLANQIGRVNPGTGTITEFKGLTPGSQPAFIVPGPDGALWFTEYGASQIGRIDPASGRITEYPVPTPASEPYGIVAGPDNMLWFPEILGNKIGRLNPATGKITEFAVPTAGSQPYAIAVGPDRKLWFTEFQAGRVGTITTDGVITEKLIIGPLGADSVQLTSIVRGHDGALWMPALSRNSLFRVTTNFLVNEFPIPASNSSPFAIASAADGSIWFTEFKGNKVGRAALTVTSEIASVNTAGAGLDIAQNTWLEIKGGNLVPPDTPSTGVIWSSAPSFASGQMPTQLGNISVTVNGKPAFVYFYCSAATDSDCQQDQINVLAPLDTALGSVPVVVTSGFVSTPPFPVNVKNVAPSLLLFSPMGYVVATHADYSLLGPATLYPGFSTPAKPNETIVLYAVGFGLPTAPLVNGLSIQSGALPAVPICQIGGQNAVVGFAGLISPGLYQLNLTVPATAASGDNPIACSYDSVATAAVDLITIQ